jgi:drug/metabolite transporter (DMT)-like permease
VGAKYGLPYADPFVFLSVRVLIAAALLLVLVRVMKMPILIGKSAIMRSSLIGFFLHACYLGGVFYAISQGLPAGVAAVVTSLQPVLVSLIAVKVLGERLRSTQVAGLLLGLVGVFLVLGPTFDSHIPTAGIVAIVVALIGSTSAHCCRKRLVRISLVAGTAYQYLFSGVVLGAIAIATRRNKHHLESSLHRSLYLVAASSVSGCDPVAAVATEHRKRRLCLILVLPGATSNSDRSFLFVWGKSKHPRLPWNRSYRPGCLACNQRLASFCNLMRLNLLEIIYRYLRNRFRVRNAHT